MAVQSLRPKLSEQDIVRLMRGITPEDRAGVAHKLCRRISIEVLSDEERQYADEIVSIIAKDAAELVRRTLATTLRNSPRLPRDVALKLARDVESVALPLLQHSPVFNDEDLVELILAVTAAGQAAIARRQKISPKVSDTICARGALDAVRTVTANKGAEISDHGLSMSLQRFPTDPPLHEAIVMREHIPVQITEKLVSLVSGGLFDQLINRHELPAQMAIDLTAGARERATIDIVDQAGRTTDMDRFVRQLNLNGRLTHSLIIRALCVGHMRFVEHAISELSGIPHQRAWLMIHDGGSLGLTAIFDRAGLHRKFLPVFKVAVNIYHELEYDGGLNDRQRFRARMVERVLTQFQAMPKPDLDYLLDKLDAYSAKPAQPKPAMAHPVGAQNMPVSPSPQIMSSPHRLGNTPSV